MAGTTTNFAIQYPSSTDYVTDGATAMKTISDDVDAILFAEVANQNLIINGAMQVSQRSAVGTAVTGITTTGYHTADRFNTTITTLGTWSQTTFVDAPAGKGFKNSLKMACTTADASPAAGDLLQIQQKIEGQNLQAVRKGTASAQILTLSFWVAAFQTGTFICELVAGSRACSKAYTVNASNTWEYKTLTFPADATTVIANDNTEGLAVNWWLGAGTTYRSGTLQTTWAATVSANRAVGQTNVASSTSNTWLMTGASLTIGDADVPFQFNKFADDLRDCMRYFQSYTYGETSEKVVSMGYSPSNYYYGTQDMRVPFRASPTVTFNSASARHPNGSGLVSASNIYYLASADGAYYAFGCSLAGSACANFFISSTQTAEL